MQKKTLYTSIRNLHVLIVEPSREIRKAVAGALQKTGLRLLAASNGQDAFTLVRKLGMPDLAIIELSLPDMSGFELANRLKQHKDLPIILTGQFVNPDQIASMLDLIADDFVTKPADEREVAARVLRLLLRRSKPAMLKEENSINDYRHNIVRRSQKQIH